MSTLNGRNELAITSSTAATALTAADVGGVFSNTGGTTGVITYTLPAATAGLWFDFYCDSTVQLVIDPVGTDKIGIPTSGALGTSGLGIAATVRGNMVRLACLKAGAWAPLTSIGTTGWTTT